jgi:hypothetical protein
VTTRARESGNVLKFRDFGYPNFSGSFTDERGFYFILEPPVPPDPEPDMDTIRAAHEPKPNEKSVEGHLPGSARLHSRF